MDELLVTTVVASWKQVVDRLDERLASLDEQQLEKQVAPDRNRLFYLLGHLTVVHDRMLLLLGIGERLHPELDEAYLSNPDRTISDPLSAADLKKAWSAVNAAITSAVEKFSADDWLKKHAARLGRGLREKSNSKPACGLSQPHESRLVSYWADRPRSHGRLIPREVRVTTRVRVGGFSISLDGFGAGPEQSLKNPLGKGGMELHRWIFGTRMFQAMIGKEGGSDGIDQEYAHRSMDGFGAFILGRNMFGPVRGPWPDESWKGWWGKNPPYHAPTFVLTHHPRDPIEMEGGTTFIFVTNGIEAALDQAKLAADGRDVKIGGGVETVRQYLRAELIDELHVALSPVVLGKGEALFAGIDLPALGFRVCEHRATEHATHIVLSR